MLLTSFEYEGECMMLKRYLIVTDLDGTLLNSDHEISEDNYNRIKHFKRENGLFTFATGRMNETVRQFIKELNITIPVITYNGAQVFCPVDHKVLYEKTFALSKEMYDQLVAASKSFAEILFFYNNQVFTTRKGGLIKEFELKEKVTCKLMELDQIPEMVTKIMVMSKENDQLEQLETYFNNRFTEVSLMYSQSDYLEILPKNTSKGEALREVKKNIALTDVYTVGFGNNLNDISLLEAVDLGIAVQNAEEGLLEVADQISTYSNNEGAVGRYIESLLLAPGQIDNRTI